MSTHVGKSERLVNLVIALLSTRQYLPVATIRATVLGYDRSGSDEAFGRMFERDKTTLRDLGIPLEYGQVSDLAETQGYRISRAAYELPDIDFTADERTALAVARRLWQDPAVAAATTGALGKLRSAGIDVDADQVLTEIEQGTTPLAGGDSAALATLVYAIDAGRRVEFTHRPPGRAEGTVRRVRPWAVVTHRGRWYLVGHDFDRDAVRTFRISRIVGKVEVKAGGAEADPPADLDAAAVVAETLSAVRTAVTAQVWVADGRGHELRRAASSARAADRGGRAGTTLEITVDSWDQAVRTIASHGADAIALDPPELRADVVAALTAVATDGVLEAADLMPSDKEGR